MKRKSLKVFVIAMSLVVCIAFTIGTTNLGNEVYGASIKLSKKTITIAKSKTYTLKVKGTKAKVKWTSSKKSVATVTSKGKVTAKKVGTAYITAKVKGKKLKCKVKVRKLYDKATVSGVGEQDKGVVLDPGVYKVSYSYTDNVGPIGETNFIAHFKNKSVFYDDLIVNDIAKNASGSTFVTIKTYGKYTLNVKDATSNTAWTFKFTKLGGTKARTFTGNGLQVGNRMTLTKGSYKITATYANNTNKRYGLNNPSYFNCELAVTGNNAFVRLASQSASASGSISKTFRINKTTYAWINTVRQTSLTSNWNISITKV